jgi:hypothetical protein
MEGMRVVRDFKKCQACDRAYFDHPYQFPPEALGWFNLLVKGFILGLALYGLYRHLGVVFGML